MNKIALTAAVLAFPAITFAGGAGNADLFDYMKNFDPSRAGERVIPVVAPIGSMIKMGDPAFAGTGIDKTTMTPTSTYVPSFGNTGAGAISEEATFSRLNYGSDYELLSEREKEARRKLLRLRNVR